MSIQITSDSTCDLPPALLSAHRIELFPLSIVKDGRSYRDGLEIAPADIFAHVAAGGELCTTSAVNLAEYMARFEALSRRSDAVIHLNIGSGFSSCCQNAKLAAASFPNVYVIDSRNLSNGHGLLVLTAAELAEAGMAAPEIVRHIESLARRVETSFLLDRLDYLRKGGRCSSVVALGANLLKLRPCIDLEDGKMHVGRKYRGAFVKCVRDYVTDRLAGRDDLDLRRVFLNYTDVPDEAIAAARETIRASASFAEIVECRAGCTISCHCGPGTLSVIYQTL